MSTLKVNDIQEATSGGGKIWPSRAWINWNGQGTVTIRDDGNFSSVSDNGTGNYNPNFTNAMSTTNYTVVMGAGYGSTGVPDSGHLYMAGNPSTSTFRIYANDTTHNTALFDYKHCMVNVTI